MPGTLYAGTRYGVFKSTNGGGNWSDTGLSDPVIIFLEIDPITPDTLYAGTDGGVFVIEEGGFSFPCRLSGVVSNTRAKIQGT